MLNNVFNVEENPVDYRDFWHDLDVIDPNGGADPTVYISAYTAVPIGGSPVVLTDLHIVVGGSDEEHSGNMRATYLIRFLLADFQGAHGDQEGEGAVIQRFLQGVSFLSMEFVVIDFITGNHYPLALNSEQVMTWVYGEFRKAHPPLVPTPLKIEGGPTELQIRPGRGHRTNNHVANQRYKLLFLFFGPTYKLLSDNQEKNRIVAEFEAILDASNMTFADQDEHGHWYSVDFDASTREKIKQACRDCHDPAPRKQKRQAHQERVQNGTAKKHKPQTKKYIH